jgi:hypothetical protein
MSIADPLLYDPKFLLNCVPAALPEVTPLNGSGARPFYIWAHNPNSFGKIDADLAAGANALEPDITLAEDAGMNGCAGTTDTTIADLVDEDSSSPYRGGLCKADTHFEDWLHHVYLKAIETGSKLALIAFDIKSSAADAVHVKNILTAIRTHLTSPLQGLNVNLNVILSVGSIADAKKAFGTGTETNWAGIRPSDLQSREAVQIDGEDDAAAVRSFFTTSPNNYVNFGYGDGSAVNAADLSFSGTEVRALDKGAFLRASVGQPGIVSYAYLINAKVQMDSFINGGADGIIPGTILSVAPILDTDCFNAYSGDLDKQAKCSFSPNPDSNLDVSEIQDLVSVVSSHPEVRVATRDDNPFPPKLQSYGLEVTTPTGEGNGTNANLQFTLTGCKGTAQMTINTGFVIPLLYTTGRMEQGNTDHVTIPSADLGTLESIKIYNDGTGLGPDWTFQDIKISSAGYIGSDANHDKEYQGLGTYSVDAFDTLTVPLKANFPGGGTFSSPDLPDVVAQCSAPLPAAPVATESCSTTSIVGTADKTGPFGQGDTTITWTFKDSAGNTKTRTQAVHVHDTIAPVANVASLPPVVAQCSATLPAPPKATDNCSGQITGMTTSPSSFGQGDFTATWTFTDAVGNHSSEDQAIQVHDTIPPVITCPANIVVNATGPTGTTVPFSVTATDNCSVTSLISVPASGGNFPIGTTTVNNQARDIALPTGNLSTCNFTVHVKSAAEQLQDLLASVTDVGPGKSLASKVQVALNYVGMGDKADACSTLADFMSEVQAQSGKKLTVAQANSLLANAARIRAVLGC